MKYRKTVLKQPLRVDNVVSIHYFEYAVDFAFSGELHNFWELVYADKGDLCVTAGAKRLSLIQGQLYLHPPGEFHNVHSNGLYAPNSVIVSFCSDCPELYELTDKIISCPEEMKKRVGAIVEEAQHAFSTPLGDPYTARLLRRPRQLYGCEQMIRLNLEMLLIGLVRQSRQRPSDTKTPVNRLKRGDKRLEEICRYLSANVGQRLCMNDLCRLFSISESALQKLFYSKMGCGAMQFYQRLKMDSAKRLIREKRMNYTEIAEHLGYSSIHYFSRQFKKQTGMAPSQYAASVNAMSDGARR